MLLCCSRIYYINHVATIFSNHKNNACLPRGLAMTISAFVNSIAMELFEWISVTKSAAHMYVTPTPIFPYVCSSTDIQPGGQDGN